MKISMKTTKSLVGILTVTTFLTAALCGCGQKEESKNPKPEASDSDTKACADNMGKFFQATLSAKMSHDKNFAFVDEWAWELGKGHYAMKPQCPSGTPYFICDLSDYDPYTPPTQDKVLAYCPKHDTVLLASQAIK